MHASTRGFTLIELSIVLVIIGLIVGGILAGQDLISAAQIRAQISQIEKYQTAVNTFRAKYNYLPGDIPDPDASAIGLTAQRCPDASTLGSCIGEGDGNGILQGYSSWFGVVNTLESFGESAVFWEDLSQTGLVEGSFTTAGEASAEGNSNTPSQNLPAGKIGGGNYVYAYSNNSTNYFGLSAQSWLGGANCGAPSSAPGLSVNQAFMIDSKIDDGMPQSGNVQAMYVNYGDSGGGAWNNSPKWAAGGLAELDGLWYGANQGASPGTAVPSNQINCYDNNNNTANLMQYSVGMNGSELNCALSFRFQ